jgi:hypothetical protein
MMKDAKSKRKPLKRDEVHLLCELRRLRKMQAEAVALARETGYVSDELIADRRAEVVNEAEETLRGGGNASGSPEDGPVRLSARCIDIRLIR